MTNEYCNMFVFPFGRIRWNIGTGISNYQKGCKRFIFILRNWNYQKSNSFHSVRAATKKKIPNRHRKSFLWHCCESNIGQYTDWIYIYNLAWMAQRTWNVWFNVFGFSTDATVTFVQHTVYTIIVMQFFFSSEFSSFSFSSWRWNSCENKFAWWNDEWKIRNFEIVLWLCRREVDVTNMIMIWFLNKWRLSKLWIFRKFSFESFSLALGREKRKTQTFI